MFGMKNDPAFASKYVIPPIPEKPENAPEPVETRRVRVLAGSRWSEYDASDWKVDDGVLTLKRQSTRWQRICVDQNYKERYRHSVSRRDAADDIIAGAYIGIIPAGAEVMSADWVFTDAEYAKRPVDWKWIRYGTPSYETDWSLSFAPGAWTRYELVEYDKGQEASQCDS